MPKEYIEREALLDEINIVPVSMSICMNVDECKGRIYERERLVRTINDAPAADVVEVVRCGKCKYGKYTGTEWFCDKHSGHADRFGEDASYHEYHSKYWFCADGERKDDDGE